MRKLFLILSLFSTLNLVGQDDFFIGRVTVESVAGIRPLSKVHLSYLKDTMVSVSNLSGMFRMPLPKESDTLKVSHIGYQTLFIPTNKLRFNERLIDLRLTESPSIIPVSEITVGQGDRIMQQVIQKLDKNYHEYLSELKGWYRHQVIQDSIYVYFGQSKLSLFPTTQRLTAPIKEQKDLGNFIKVLVHDAEMSEDAKDPRLMFKSSLYELLFSGVFQNDPILDFPHMFNFHLGKVIFWEGYELFQIRFEAKTEHQKKLNARGVLYIDKKTMAIVHKQWHNILAPHSIEGATPLNSKFTAVFTTYSYIVTTDYERFNNQWRPKFIQREWKLDVHSKEYPGINHKYFLIDDYYTFSQKNLTKLPEKFDGYEVDITDDMKEQMKEHTKQKIDDSKLKEFNWFILPDFELDRYEIDY